MPTFVAEVILDQSLDKTLDYALPYELKDLPIGTRVEVPLRSKTAKGTLLALKTKSAFADLKQILRPLSEEPLVTEELFRLAHFVSTYYCAPLNRVIKTLLPPMVRDETKQHKSQSFVRPCLSINAMKEKCEELRCSHPAQAAVLDLLLQSPKGLLLTEILEKGGISQSPVKTLAKQEILRLEKVQLDRSPLFEYPFFPTRPKKLNQEQQKVLDQILEKIDTFQAHLLHGVTGSGKTEIYLQAIQKALDLGKGVLYLVPEIALTSQTIERFKGRFGDEKIAILHHRLGDGERFDAWHNIRRGSARIVIGARSAIFSPLPHLGMIIIDEEHESAYKQSEEGPKYHARDVAVIRAKFANCPIILGSATPSIESYYNALNGKYQLHTLCRRADSAMLPTVNLIDMKKEMEQNKGFTLFSSPLIGGIQKRLEKGEQILLFLNRRGYHTSSQCPKCAYVECCPHCDLALTYHKADDLLACHLCDWNKPPARNCPSCNADGPLKFKGAGTELVEKTLHALFPTIRTLRLDADTTRHKGSHERIFKAFRSGKADVLIGTQMIAKGLHFPLVTLVGVLGVDGSLNIPDFRASETAFQLLTQVAGRSGRGELKGEVLIQTQLLEHSTILHAAKQDYLSYYAEEIETRQTFAFPPFTHLIKFSFTGSSEKICEEEANAFRTTLISHLPKEVEIYPVVPCGYAKIKGKFRYQCLLKVEKVGKVLFLIENLRQARKKRGDIRLSIDVDPLTTFF
jgi:primosomal protein N' (replication factor Y) (superfamily II helicase)